MSTTILSEDFEGNLPSDNGWVVADTNASGTTAYWDCVDSTFGGVGTHSGNKKAYCAGVGYAGTISAPTYQSSMTADMSRAVDLTGLPSATLRFWYKMPSIDPAGDYLRVYVDSIRILNTNSPVTSWTQWTYDLRPYLGSAHTLKIEFYSNASATAEGAYLDDITVTDEQVNRAPTGLGLSNSSVVENQPIGTIVGVVSGTDPDAGQSATLAFSLVSGYGDNARFTINPTTNQLQTATAFDYETKSSYSVKIRATDTGGLTYDKIFTVSVADGNDAPTAIALSNSTVLENQAVGTVVGVVSGTDPDAGQSATLSFSLVSGYGNTDQFSLDPITHQLKTAAAFDYETKSGYSLKILATDAGNPVLTYDKVFVVNVTNVNEAPTDISLSISSVTESLPVGTAVGVVSGTDPDLGQSTTLTYSLVGDYPDNTQFSIDAATRQLKTAAVFVYETRSGYTINIRATDAGGLNYEEAFTLALTLNHAPTDMALPNASVAENASVGTAVGVVSGTDPDMGQSATLSFSLIGGYGDNAQFSINSSTKQLKTAAIFDYETKSSYSVKIRATDVGGLTYDEDFIVNVTDVNEMPTDILLSNAGVAENELVGTVVGLLSGKDPDVGQSATLTFSLVSGYGDNAQFTIDPATSQLTTAAVFDYETKSSYSIAIRATDAGSPARTYDKAFTVSVTNVIEAPTDIVLSSSSVAEHKPVGTVVAAVSGTADAGLNATLVFTLVSGYGDNDQFSIDPTTRVLKTAAVFDHHARNSCSIKIRATDTRGLTCEKVFTIAVGDTRYVDAGAPGPIHDGVSWATAYTDLQLALVAAMSGDTIKVAQGTYKPTSGTDRTISFQLTTGVEVDGGYAGYGAGNPETRNAETYSSILSGDIATVGSNADNSYHVLVGSGVDATAVLNGFTITAGNANISNSFPNSYGGGMYNSGGSPTISNCTFTGNSAYDLGGGIFNDSSSPILTGCTFSENTASSGGGMYNVNSSPTLADCAFRENQASQYGGSGGGIYSSSSSLALTNCTFTRNTAFWGGGIYTDQSSASLMLTSCTFNGNSARYSGGGMFNESGSPNLANCTFVGNTAANAGGGIYGIWSVTSLVNCTFSGHSSDFAGAITCDAGSLTLTNCILRDASESGNRVSSSGNGSVTIAYCDAIGYGGIRNINVDPLFVRNPSPGSDGTWGTVDDDYGDLRLRLISPVIDAGNNAAVPSNTTLDRAGSSRWHDTAGVLDTGTGTAPIVDMGAYEATGAPQAMAGGPYTLLEGLAVALVGTGYSDNGLVVSYAWDFDADGVYDDATGPAPTFSAGGMHGPQAHLVSLRVTDSSGATAFDTATVNIVRPIYVDDTATGANTGTSWSDAYVSLQTALATATAGQTILVGQGTYTPSATGDQLASITLKTDVEVYGGYAGFGAAEPYHRDIGNYPSILSGDIGVIGTTADNSRFVVDGSGTSSTAVLDGFTVTGTGSHYVAAAGMYNSGGTPTVRNCTFSGNNGVGMVNCDHASPTLTNCVFSGNTASGMSNTNYSSPTLNNCTFSGNTGGGMDNAWYSSPTLVSCIFRGNTTTSDGGGMYNYYYSAPTLTNCVFSGNSTSGSVGCGGGMFNVDSSSPTLINCTFSGNTAYSGGGIYNYLYSATLVNCVLWGNTAQSDGQISGLAEATYSDIQGGLTGTGNINADPQFARIPSAGSDGRWGTADDDYGDLRLRLTSPAIDAGRTDFILAGIATDVAGDPRRQDIASVADTGAGTAPMVDMGAYEANVGLLALAGGTYSVLENFTVGLNGLGYSDRGLALSFAWDFDADGVYDDATGPTPTFSTAGMQGPQIRVISLRVTDSSGIAAFDTAMVYIVRPLYVDDTTTGANNGTSWTNAYHNLQSALAAATTGQTILVGQGTYKPSTTGDRTASFVLKTGVSIYGGFAGVGAADPYSQDVRHYPSVLSGDIGIASTSSDNSYHVVIGSGTDARAVLDGFTITAGYGGSGAGMYNGRGSPTIRNCTFSSNTGTSSASGGGMYNDDYSSPTLTNCTFIGNTASSDGGGMYNGYHSSPILTNCTFIGNTASSDGGGMYNDYSATPTLTNCTFAGNKASYYGGGMYSPDPATLTNCILWGNTGYSGSQLYGSPSASYNDIQGGFTGTGNINADPLFVRNPSSGADGVWGTADDDYGDLRLRPTSPAVDAGNNAAIPAGITTDLAGNPRRQDVASVVDTGAGAAPIVDMGAYEANPGPLALSGGPYTVLENCSIGLKGVGYGESGLAVSYAWDFDADGLYDDAMGPTATFSAAGMLGPQARAISLRVTDSSGASAFDTATVTIVRPLYVDDTATGANDGTSWTNAYQSLQSALGVATAGQTIVVGQGTYKPTTTGDRAASFALKTGVAIYGGYAGVGAAAPDARNVCLYPSVLSGDIGVIGKNTDNSYHVVIGSGTTNSAVLDGFAITGGNANGLGMSGSEGGGVYNSSGSPSIRDCRIVGNVAGFYGGGVYSAGTASVPSVLTLTNCAISGNSASFNGGGIYSDYSAVVALTNCTLSGNAGGGAYISSTSPKSILTNCVLWGNTSGQMSGSATVTYSDVQQSSGAYSGAGNINADPRFVRSPSAGIDGTWGTADDDYGDLRLLSASPAINVGSNAAVPVDVTTDLAGNPRIVGAAVDMGAYEYSPSTLTFVGSAGNDAMYSRLSTDQTQLQVWRGTGTDGTLLGSYPVAGSPGFVFDVGGGSNSLVLDVSNGVPAVPVNFVGGAGPDTLTITGIGTADTVNAQAGKIVVGAATVYTPGTEAVVLDAASGAVIEMASLTVSTAVSLAAGKNLVLRPGSLNITAGGTLDLAGNGMILNYGASSPVTTVNQWISNGRMGITPGLKTTGTVAAGTAALGMVDNALIHLSSFAGHSLGGVFSQLLIQNTVAGDANLDGVVDNADYLAVIANMGRTGAQWFLGDLNADGAVTADDFAEVTAHVGNQVAGTSMSMLPAAAKPKAAPVAAAKKLTAAKPKPVVKTKIATKRKMAKGK